MSVERFLDGATYSDSKTADKPGLHAQREHDFLDAYFSVTRSALEGDVLHVSLVASRISRRTGAGHFQVGLHVEAGEYGDAWVRVEALVVHVETGIALLIALPEDLPDAHRAEGAVRNAPTMSRLDAARSAVRVALEAVSILVAPAGRSAWSVIERGKASEHREAGRLVDILSQERELGKLVCSDRPLLGGRHEHGTF